MRRKNALMSGQVRHGWLISDRHEPIPAAISRDRDSVTLTLTSRYAEPAERWPEQLDPRTSWDSLVDLVFIDEEGTIELAECFPNSRRGTGPGKMVEKWEFQPRFVILDGNGRTWGSVTTIETFAPMLREWLGESARRIDWNLTWENDGEWLGIDLKSPYSIDVNGDLSHQIIAESRTESSPRQDGIHAFSAARISTRLRNASERDVAMAEHASILDFLTIVFGRRTTYSTRKIQSLENPVLGIDGTAFDPNFTHECEVLSPQDHLDGSDYIPEIRSSPLIFSSSDAALTLSRWLKFQSENRVGVAALIRAISERRSWENKLLNTAVAFEEFGYKLSGSVECGTSDSNFPTYVKRICLDMPRITMARPEIWARRFNAAYKGIKHADNEIPGLREIVVTTEQGIGFLRAWCCFKADPENPIIDPFWGRLIDFEEFYPASGGGNAEEDWRGLIPDSVWDEEFTRLGKARMD